MAAAYVRAIEPMTDAHRQVLHRIMAKGVISQSKFVRAAKAAGLSAEDDPTEVVVNTFLDTVNPALDVIGLELESAVDRTRHVICLSNRLADELVKGAHGLEEWEADAVRAIFAAMRDNGGSLSMAQFDALQHKGKRASGKAPHLLLSRLLDEGYVRSPAEGELVPGPRVAGSWGGSEADTPAGAAAASSQAAEGSDGGDEEEGGNDSAAGGRRAKRRRADSEDGAASPSVKPEPGTRASDRVKPEPGSPLVKPEPGSDEHDTAPPRQRLRRTNS
ncbi:hypothetical protein FNF31_07352 [Cafeteria roenbergensis]|uniref:Uncharacterized protein n=1 Tax=Cafeteria roenbergensis TaxID=33653 RepID=A0A5A8C7P5_CAFRO|nr:hypothetical protein FNF31_07352 [Cafeteria roenbergensis]KAA0157784.1 hypothetical protein FNF28_06493 [Cafeteria roenbergensis]